MLFRRNGPWVVFAAAFVSLSSTSAAFGPFLHLRSPLLGNLETSTAISPQPTSARTRCRQRLKGDAIGRSATLLFADGPEETGRVGISGATSDEGSEIDASSEAAPSTTTAPASPDPPPPPPMTSPDVMRALGTSPRRIFISLGSASFIALGANFLGCTSALLGNLPPETLERSGLDAFYPVNGYKRFTSSEFRYTFVIPNGWAADTSVELAKATRRSGTLDYRMSKRPAGSGIIPDAAFGPPSKFDSRGVSSNTDTNVSAIASKAPPGFTLRSLGWPTEAAETLLRVSLAPEGSGRRATLLSASEVAAGAVVAYRLEYDVDRGEKGVPLRAISNVAVREGEMLVTMTVVGPLAAWEGEGGAKLRRVAESFRLNI